MIGFSHLSGIYTTPMQYVGCLVLKYNPWLLVAGWLADWLAGFGASHDALATNNNQKEKRPVVQMNLASE